MRPFRLLIAVMVVGLIVAGEAAQSANVSASDLSLLSGVLLDGAMTDPAESPDGVALAPSQDPRNLADVVATDGVDVWPVAAPPLGSTPSTSAASPTVVSSPPYQMTAYSIRTLALEFPAIRRVGPAKHRTTASPRCKRCPDEGRRGTAVLLACRCCPIRLANGGRLPALARCPIPEDRRHGPAHADRDRDPLERRDLRAVPVRLLSPPDLVRADACAVVFGHGTGFAAVALCPPRSGYEGRLVPEYGAGPVRNLPPHRPRVSAVGDDDRRRALSTGSRSTPKSTASASMR